MLSATKKRYLFAIYELGQNGKAVRCKDVASSLKIKPPSVSKMLNALSEDGLIEKNFTARYCLRKLARPYPIGFIRII